jgi:hypothetical protein
MEWSNQIRLVSQSGWSTPSLFIKCSSVQVLKYHEHQRDEHHDHALLMHRQKWIPKCSEEDPNPNIWLAQLRHSCTAHALLIVLVVDCAHGSVHGWWLTVRMVHGWWCSWLMVFMVDGVHGWWCSWLMVFMVDGVHGWWCSWLTVFMVDGVHGWQCAWLTVFIANKAMNKPISLLKSPNFPLSFDPKIIQIHQKLILIFCVPPICLNARLNSGQYTLTLLD